MRGPIRDAALHRVAGDIGSKRCVVRVRAVALRVGACALAGRADFIAVNVTAEHIVAAEEQVEHAAADAGHVDKDRVAILRDVDSDAIGRLTLVPADVAVIGAIGDSNGPLTLDIDRVRTATTENCCKQ